MPRLLTSVFAVALVALLSAPLANGDDPRDACAACHDDQFVEEHRAGPHGRMADGDWFGASRSCGSCHGDVTTHAEMADPSLVRTFPGTRPEADSDLCLSCHASMHALGAWPAGEHAIAGLACTDCHAIHSDGEFGRVRAASLGVRPEEDLYERCFECHPEVRAEVRFPSRHPLLEGKMNCGSCHDPHGTTFALLKTEFRKSDVCLDCHPAMQGPFVFEHEPVQEDCTICHNAHGSVAEPMLRQSEPFICLQCHETHFHTVLGGNPGAANTNPPAGTTFLPDGSDMSVTGATLVPIDVQNPFGRMSMKRAFLTKCTQCHSAVHGSDLPAAGITGGGKAFTR